MCSVALVKFKGKSSNVRECVTNVRLAQTTRRETSNASSADVEAGGITAAQQSRFMTGSSAADGCCDTTGRSVVHHNIVVVVVVFGVDGWGGRLWETTEEECQQ